MSEDAWVVVGTIVSLALIVVGVFQILGWPGVVIMVGVSSLTILAHLD